MTEPDTVSDGAWENIKVMRAIAKRDDQPDMVAVELVQEIADIVDRARGKIPDDDCAVLLGIGSNFVRQAETEIMAGIQAFTGIRKGAGR